MFTLAITGGLGAGKSTASRWFVARGATVISLDEVARETLADDPAVLRDVVSHFGDSVVGEDGRLDRAALAGAAFRTVDAAHTLNSIVHPAAIEVTKRRLAELAARADTPVLVVLDIPLLAEAPGLLVAADAVLAIAAPMEARIARAVAREMSEADARRRIAAQATDADRAGLANAVIENDGDIEGFEAALARFWREHIADRLGTTG